MDAFTPRNVAKFVTTTSLKFAVAGAAHNAITDHTRFDEDDKIVDIASAVIGWGVADKLKPTTDKIVDKVADKVNERRAARAAKKDTPSES
jgi:hypothetical protein